MNLKEGVYCEDEKNANQEAAETVIHSVTLKMS